ncbi:outer membrane beta-barrel protein [Helicobacter cappadocius]|uniref:Outer membrane beta-barrel protein n=1 Tax=Helicobacter cappadocius TaxID=3063998 RepID=A0AA90TBX2_9HELI|nr:MULTISPECIES: outer membrane beta-barrel protein [unclassified Helicobacter]MDO7253329.1 outer membrane beta-barrel protein [Helicobacter sp. faydin-H75]MDP2539241.1 outer membrane beta-barrel protein [Helicobacter sp. faydin-H76]
MKKNLLLTLLLTLSMLTSLANARFFLGIDGGYSMDKVDVKTEDKTTYTGTNTIVTPGSFTKNAYLGNGYLFDINLGTEHHFDKNNYVGFRWFLAGGYGRTTLINQSNNLIKYPSSIIEANLGLDLLLDVIKFGNNSVGLFGGIEATGLNVFSMQKDTVIFDTPEIQARARIGLSLFLADHHRIEFITKIPVYTLNGDENIYKPLQFMLGYKYVF